MPNTLFISSRIHSFPIFSLPSSVHVLGPLGVTTGVLISKIATPLMDGIIVAITAGTFLYVGATEVVGEEFDDVQGTCCNVLHNALLR